MSEYFEVIMPQLGVNDTEVTIVEWLLEPGVKVERGQTLANVETSKAAFELESEESGFFYPVAAPGATVSIRTVVALISPEADPGVVQQYLAARPEPAEQPEGPRLTAKARKLAEDHGVDLAQFPTGRIIRERDVRALLEEASAPTVIQGSLRRVAIYGASQGGLAILECLRTMGEYEVAAFLDDDPGQVGTDYHGVPIWSGKDLEQLGEKRVGAISTHIASGNTRLALRDRAHAANVACLNVIHGNATVSSTARMGVGNVIKAGAVVDAHVEIGDCCIVDNGVILPHHNRIGDACHLAPGACFGGDCDVGDGTIIGIGATVTARTRIGRNVIVGAGACVLRDIPDNAVVEGHPAKIVGTRKEPGAVIPAPDF